MSTRRGAGELHQEQTQLQWLIEVVRKFGAPPLAFSLDEAALQLGIKRTKLDRLISLGLIRVVHYEPGDHPKVTRSELERFLSEKMDEASQDAHGSSLTVKRRTRAMSAGVVDVEADIERARALRKKQRRT